MTSVSGASEAMALPGAAGAGWAASPGTPAGCLPRRRRRGPFLSTARRPDEAPRSVVNAIVPPPDGSGRNLAQHFQAGDTGGNFPQCGDRGLVLAFDARFVTLRELARTIGGGERQRESVRDLFQTVFYSNTCHVVPLVQILVSPRWGRDRGFSRPGFRNESPAGRRARRAGQTA